MEHKKYTKEEVEVKALIEKSKLEYIRDNLTKDNNCNCCKHIESCMSELLTENINPDEYVCLNFETKGKENE